MVVVFGLAAWPAMAHASQVSAPAFSPAAGTYVGTQSVTIKTSTSGACLRYTTDGSTPTESHGTSYSSAVSISATTTLKAIAYKSGMTNSTVTSGTYTIAVATPTFSPAAGTYTGTQSVTIKTSTSGAAIRYTTDGSAPTESHGTLYSSAVSISTTTTLKAIAYKSGLTDSSVASATYTIKLAQVATPTFSPAGGNYTSTQSVAISTSTSGATIRYTTDGSTPTETNGTVYSAKISIGVTTTLKAIAYKSGMTDSSGASATYVFKPVITSPASATGQFGTAFFYQITATNIPTSYSVTGTVPAGFSVLPAGLNLNTSTGAITGTPTATGTSSVTMNATNAAGTGSSSLNITINREPVTFTISPLSFTYNRSTQGPVITPSVAGATFSTSGASAISTGSYTATASGTGNYTGTTSAGWTIAQATPVVSWATPAPITFGTALSSAQLNATASDAIGSVGGTFVYTPTAGTILNAGTQTLAVTFTPSDANDYTTAPASVSLQVNKATAATPTVTASANPSTFPATVTLTPGNGTTGAYTWKINGAAIATYNGSSWTPASGSYATGTWSTSGLNLLVTPSSVANYTIAFTDNGNANYNGASSTPFTETVSPPLPALAPVFSPGAGTYLNPQSVTITSATTGAAIRYTTDGSSPTETNGTVYSGPVTITSTTTLLAIAYASGFTDSTVTSAVYTILPPVAAPVFSPGGGTYTSAQTVTITSATPGASIRYTTDGSTPSETTGTLYSSSSPVSLSANTVLNAIAYEAGMTDSPVTGATYTINLPPVAADQSVTTAENAPTTVTLAATQTNGDALTYAVASQPAHGTLSGTAPNLTYTPAANYFGADSFTFTASDGSVSSNTATASITVTKVNYPPVAQNQTVTTAENAPATITLVATQTNNDALTYVVASQPAHGTLSGTAPNLTYTPAMNYFGADSFTFTAQDGTVSSNTATVSITVTRIVTPPIAQSQSVTTTENAAVNITLVATQANNDQLTYAVATSPMHGNLSGTAPNLTYTPQTNYYGTDNFTFVAKDGPVSSNTATVSITVTKVDFAPVAQSQSVTTLENAPVAITLGAAQANNQPLTYSVVAPDHGTLSGIAPNLKYTPAANYYGPDSFNFRANDGTKNSNTATVSITVTKVNFPPVASNQSVVIPENSSVAITLAATQTNNDALTYAAGAPSHGTLSGTAPNLTYTPASNYFGSDSFTFVANDGTVSSSLATVSITVTEVNYQPVAQSQSVTTAENTPLTIALVATQANNDVLAYHASAPSHGTLSGTAPNFTYTPAANFFGSDSFTFVANDGSVSSNNATVSIVVTEVNFPPVAQSQSVLALENTALAITLVATQTNNDPLTYAVSAPSHGTLSGTAPNLTYTPTTNYVGPDSFTFVANDGAVSSNTATVTITEAPLVATPQSVMTLKNTPVAITLAGTQVNNDPLTFAVATQPANGTLSGTAPNLTYTPAANYVGSDSFTFVAVDGTAASAPASVTITASQPLAASAGPDQTVFVSASDLYGVQIIANNDDWTFSDNGFGAAPTAAQFALNIAKAFAPGHPAKFLAYSNDNLLVSASMAATLTGAGIQWTVESSGPTDLPTLLQYDGVFLEGVPVNNQDLINYVMAGGHVYVGAGTGGPDQQMWNTFLGAFGLQYASLNGIGGAIPVNSTNPLLAGVSSLYYANGNSVYRLSTSDPSTDIIASYQGQGLLGTYSAPSISFALQGTVTDNSGGTSTYAWNMVSGPGVAQFADPNALDTTVTFSTSGTYVLQLTATDGQFSASSTVTITVNLDQPPVVSTGPDIAIGSIADTAQLNGEVIYVGQLAAQLVSQWTLVAGPGTVAFGDASQPNTTATFTAPGIYTLQLTANDGVTHASSFLEVRVGERYPAGLPRDPTDWWPLNNIPTEVIHGNHDVQIGLGMRYGPGEVAEGLIFNGTTAFGSVPAHADLDIGSSSQGFSIEFWVNPATVSGDTRLIQWSNGTKEGLSLRLYQNAFYIEFNTTNGGHQELDGNGALQANTWRHVAVTYDKITGLLRLYVNGRINYQQNIGAGLTAQTSTNLYFGTTYNQGQYFNGSLDEIALYSRPITPAEVYSIYSAGTVGKCPPHDFPPAVNAGPDLVVPSANGVATLNGTVTNGSGPGPLTVTWSQLTGPGTTMFANADQPVTSATFSAPGLYVLELNADDGLNQAQPGIVEVRVGVLSPVGLPNDPAAWWPGNGMPTEVVHGHDMQLVNGVTYGEGEVSLGFAFANNTYGWVPGSGDLDIGSSSQGFSIEFWINPASAGNPDTRVIQWSDGAHEGLALRLVQNSFYIEFNGMELDGVGALQANTWRHVAVTYDKITGLLRLYVNGRINYQQNIGAGLTAQTSTNFYFGTTYNQGQYFNGSLDEITLYSRPITPAEVQAIYQAGGTGKSPIGDNSVPVVNAGPDIAIPTTAATANLDGVTTGGSGPLFVTWSKLGGPGNVSFGDQNQAVTTAKFDTPGLYTLELDANDGLNQAVPGIVVVRVGLRYPSTLPNDPAAWWPGNGAPTEVVHGHDMQLVNGLTYGLGEVSLGFQFNGTNSYGWVPRSSDLDVGSSAQGFSIEFWINPASAGNPDTRVIQWSDGAHEGLALRLVQNSFYIEFNGMELDGIGALQANTWQHVTITYDKITGLLRLYVNGLINYQQVIAAHLTAQTSTDLYFGTNYLGGRSFNGSLDEITLFFRPITPEEVYATSQSGVLGLAPIDANSPPVVDAGPDIAIPDITSVASLTGTAAGGDGPGPLAVTWSKLNGPGNVTFGNASQAATTATFDAPGLYLLELDATDGLNQATPGIVTVRVGVSCSVTQSSDVAAWWPGNGTPTETVHGNHDIQFVNGLTYGPGEASLGFLFVGNSAYGWVPRSSDLDVGSSAQGFSIEMWVNPASVSNDTRLFDWSDGAHEGVALRQYQNSLYGEFNGSEWGGNPALRANTWQHVVMTYDKTSSNGPATIYVNGQVVEQANFGTNFSPQTSTDLYFGTGPTQTSHFVGSLDEITLYNRALSQAEVSALFTAGAVGKCPTVTNHAPIVNAGPDFTTYVAVPVSLQGTAVDDGLPNPPSALTYQWSLVSGPGTVNFSAPAALATTATFSAAGTYTLQLSANDSQLTGTDSLTVTVTTPSSPPPVISFVYPTNGTTLIANSPFQLQASATDSGGATITQVKFFRDGTSLGAGLLAISPAHTYFYTFNSGLPVGSYTFTAQATNSTGVTTVSASISVSAITDPGIDPYAELDTLDGAPISQPTAIIGVAASPVLSSWVLQYRLKAADSDPNPPTWTTLATGTSNIGTPPSGNNPSVPGALATFDPTMLLNGIYELQLSVTDDAGRTITDGPVTVIVEGNAKLGQFTLAFNDLTVPTPGVPITVTRTYDSRDTKVGDFGPGWNIALNNIRVQKSHTFDSGWFQTLPPIAPELFWWYSVTPEYSHTVTATFPDGTTYQFEAGVFVDTTHRRPGDPENSSLDSPVADAHMHFYAQGTTVGTLEPLDSNNQPSDNIFVEGVGDTLIDTNDTDGMPYDATRFRLTTKDGTQYILDLNLGLIQVTDLNGNTLVLNRDAQNRVTSIVSTQNATGGPVSTTVTINRDSTGRIGSITDPAGQSLDYLYDAQGRLSSFTDRALNTTQFFYENPSFPDYLTRVVDPLGNQAIRSEYDTRGHLIKQIDADGHETDFAPGSDATGNFEKITDRLGHVTTNYYDDQGDIVLKIDPLGGQTVYTFDSNNDQTSVTDPLGHKTTMTYDAQKNLLTQKDPLGNTTTYTYDAGNRPLTITDARGKVTTNVYDGNGNLTSTTDPQGNVTHFAYDGAGNLVSTTDAAGNTTTMSYDGAGNLAQTTDTSGHVTSYTYDANRNRLTQATTRTKADGTTETLTTSYAYDADNRVTKTTFPDGSTTQTAYNAIGQQSSVTDQLGHVTNYTYDDQGRLTTTAYADSTSESTGYDANGNAITTTDRAGHTTTTTYDALNRATKVTYADGSFTQTAYDVAGRVTSTTDALGNGTTFGYDDAGRRTSVKDALGNTSAYAYDPNGNQTSFTDAASHVTSYAYDDDGRRTTVTFPDSTTQITSYDALGHKVATTDQSGKITRYRYDALSRLVEVRQYLDQSLAASDSDFHLSTLNSQLVSTTYAYDELGHQISQADALGRVTSYAYDSIGRRVSRTLPGGQAESYTYDAAGNLASKKDFNGYTTTYTYDVMNRPTEVDADPAHPSLTLAHAPAKLTYAYDALGQRTSATVLNAASAVLYTETLAYDTRSRLVSKAPVVNGSALSALTYTYDAQGNLAALLSSNVSGVNLAYAYDALNRLQTVTAFDPQTSTSQATDYTYDAVGNLQSVTLPNNVTSLYTYDSLNRLTNLAASRLGTPLASYAYTLDASGHRTSSTELNGRTNAYAYDNLYRLTSETITAGIADPAPAGAVSYSLDKVGNRLSRTATGALSSQLSTLNSSYDQNDRLTSDTYDANGNTLVGTTANGATLTSGDVYDFENRLIRRTSTLNSQLSTTDLLYDCDGNRISKTISGSLSTTTTFLVDTNNPTGFAQVLEERVNGVLNRTYAYGSDLISQSQVALPSGWTTSYYSYDGHGSVRQLTDELGNVTDSYIYDAFGNLIYSSGSTRNSYFYCGEQFDSGLGLYYLRARYMNQNTGRFWNMDNYEGNQPHPASLHKYLYTSADPVGRIDPSGKVDLAELSIAESIDDKLSSLEVAFNVAQQGRTIKRILDVVGTIEFFTAATTALFDLDTATPGYVTKIKDYAPDSNLDALEFTVNVSGPPQDGVPLFLATEFTLCYKNGNEVKLSFDSKTGEITGGFGLDFQIDKIAIFGQEIAKLSFSVDGETGSPIVNPGAFSSSLSLNFNAEVLDHGLLSYRIYEFKRGYEP